MKKCPACASVLIKKTVYADFTSSANTGPIEVDLCLGCGGVWFDKGEVEAISYSKLPELLEGKKVTPPLLTAQACSSCGCVLQPLRSQNLPREINASFCPACRGVFFSPTNLLKYKKAQMSKIAYFKNFNIPLPTSSLLLTSIIGLLLVSTLTIGSFLRNRLDNRARAVRLISKPFITTLAANRATLTFTTQEPVVSQIEITASYIVQPHVLPVSNTPTTLHQITLKDLHPAAEYSYKLILFDEDNIKTSSEAFTFRTP